MTIDDKKVPPNPEKCEQGKPEPQPCGNKLYLPDDVYECLLPREHEPPCSPYAASQPLVPQPPLTPKGEQIEFEKTVFANPGFRAFPKTQMLPGIYENPFLQAAWEGWQVRSRWEPLVPQQEPTLPMCEICHCEFDPELAVEDYDTPDPSRWCSEYCATKAGVPSEQGTTRCSYCNGPVLCTNCQVDRIKEFVEEIGDPVSEQGTPPQGTRKAFEQHMANMFRFNPAQLKQQLERNDFGLPESERLYSRPEVEARWQGWRAASQSTGWVSVEHCFSPHYTTANSSGICLGCKHYVPSRSQFGVPQFHEADCFILKALPTPPSGEKT